jgi:hypothetical protein
MSIPGQAARPKQKAKKGKITRIRNERAFPGSTVILQTPVEQDRKCHFPICRKSYDRKAVRHMV